MKKEKRKKKKREFALAMKKTQTRRNGRTCHLHIWNGHSVYVSIIYMPGNTIVWVCVWKNRFKRSPTGKKRYKVTDVEKGNQGTHGIKRFLAAKQKTKQKTWHSQWVTLNVCLYVCITNMTRDKSAEP